MLKAKYYTKGGFPEAHIGTNLLLSLQKVRRCRDWSEKGGFSVMSACKVGRNNCSRRKFRIMLLNMYDKLMI